MSRGGINHITMSDNSEVYINQLLDRLDSNNFPAMAGKPKLLYIDVNNSELAKDTGLLLPKSHNKPKIGDHDTHPLKHVEVIKSQATTGESRANVELSAPIVADDFNTVACKADFVTLLASFPRYNALHNSQVGSIATRVLVETFYKHAHSEHINDLATRVRRKLSSKEFVGNKQVFSTIDTLTKNFYLFPVSP